MSTRRAYEHIAIVEEALKQLKELAIEPAATPHNQRILLTTKIEAAQRALFGTKQAVVELGDSLAEAEKEMAEAVEQIAGMTGQRDEVQRKLNEARGCEPT